MTSLTSRANGYGGVECYDYEGDDAAIESTIRTNSALVPSYSEAMSMDRIGRDPAEASSGRARCFNVVDNGGANRGNGASRPLPAGPANTFGVARQTVYGSIVYRDDGRAFFRSEVPTEITDSQRRCNRYRIACSTATDQSLPPTAHCSTTSSAGTTTSTVDSERERKRRRQSYHEAVSDPIGSRSSLSVFGRRRLNGGGCRQLRRKSDVGVVGSGAR